MIEGLPMWVIYERPKDAPEHYVVRRWVVAGGVVYIDPEAHAAPNLEAARRLVPPGLVLTMPQPDEDPAIREVWL